MSSALGVYKHFCFFIQRELPNLDDEIAIFIRNNLGQKWQLPQPDVFSRICVCLECILYRQPEIEAASACDGDFHENLYEAMLTRPGGATEGEVNTLIAAYDTLQAAKGLAIDELISPIANAAAVFVCLMSKYDPENALIVFEEVKNCIIASSHNA